MAPDRGVCEIDERPYRRATMGRLASTRPHRSRDRSIDSANDLSIDSSNDLPIDHVN